MDKPIHIVVAGIGGVGGYFGGLLAKAYAGDKNISTSFIARGEHLTQLKKNGLKVIKGEIAFHAIPTNCTDSPAQLKAADYIIICTKSYHLKEILEQIKPIIHQNTVILPLLNGIEPRELIQSHFPNHLVAQGCAYIVSAIKAPGVVENLGTRQEIYFGIDQQKEIRLEILEDIFKGAGIEATLATRISPLIWEKYIFLSSLATATTYFKKNVGDLLKYHLQPLKDLLQESLSVAKAMKIEVANNTIALAMAHYHALPYTATSSMQRDFQAGNSKTELESITGYIVRAAKLLQLNTPNFNRAYLALSQL